MARALAIFFACTTAALAVVVVWWLVAPQFFRANEQTRSDHDIVFATKLFVGTKAFVAARGTLSADWMAYKNNTFSILCTPEECIVASVNQIGPKQVGAIDGPTVYPRLQPRTFGGSMRQGAACFFWNGLEGNASTAAWPIMTVPADKKIGLLH
jgi:hypothetical protein